MLRICFTCQCFHSGRETQRGTQRGTNRTNVIYHHNCLFDMDNEQVHLNPALIHFFDTKDTYDYFDSISGYRFFYDAKCVDVGSKCESRAFNQFCCDDDSLVPLPETSGIGVVSKKGKITHRIADPPQEDISISIFCVNGSFYCHNQSSVFIFKLNAESNSECPGSNSIYPEMSRGVPRRSEPLSDYFSTHI
jgi:hypothetical protein